MAESSPSEPWQPSLDSSPTLARNRLEPRLAVSVLIAANGPRERLAWQLASLVGQRYPGYLLEVVVAFAGDVPEQADYEIRPAHCRFVTYDRELPPRTGGCNAAAEAADGQLFLVLDSATIPWPDHVRRHVDLHLHSGPAVVLGRRDLPADWPPRGSLEEVCAALGAGRAPDLVGRGEAEAAEGPPHTRGIPLSLRRSAFRNVQGFDSELPFDGELELLYRLQANGGALATEPDARSWYCGPKIEADESHLIRQFLAQRIPPIRSETPHSGAVERIPAVEILVEVGAEQPGEFEGRILPLLTEGRGDVRVTAVPADSETAVTLAAYFQGEPRVRVVRDLPAPDPAVPHRVRVPADVPITFKVIADARASADPTDSLGHLTERIREATAS